MGKDYKYTSTGTSSSRELKLTRWLSAEVRTGLGLFTVHLQLRNITCLARPRPETHCFFADCPSAYE